MPTPRVFISYRRDDEPDFVERICDWLCCRFGRENVFMDLDIPNFTNFDQHIVKELNRSDVLVSIIGPRWVELLEAKSKSGDDDYLIREIEIGLERDIVIAPIRIKGGQIPPLDKHPDSIKKMFELETPELNARKHFLDNADRIINDVETQLKKRGLKFDQSTELDQLLNQPLGKVGADVFALLKQKDFLQIEKYLRELPTHLLDEVSKIEELPDDTHKTLTDKAFAFGINFVQCKQLDNQLELFQLFLRALQLVFDGAHKRFSDQSGYSTKTLSIWSELLRTLHVLGAILIQEKKHDWLAYLLKYPISWEIGHNKRSHWIRYMDKETIECRDVKR